VVDPTKIEGHVIQTLVKLTSKKGGH